MKSLAVCMLILAVSSIVGAGTATGAQQESQSPRVEIPDATPSSPAAAALAPSRKDYSLGADVILTFTVSNHSKSPLKYLFSSAQMYDVVITDINGAEVWTWSKNRVFGQLMTSQTIPSGHFIDFKVKWLQRDDNDHPVPPGIYTATAVLLPMARTMVTGNLLSNTNNDPANIGMPTIDHVQSGAVKINNTTPPVSAKATFVIDTNS